MARPHAPLPALRFGWLPLLCAAVGCAQNSGVEGKSAGLQSADWDGDGFPASEDCNDREALIHPDAVELCDGSDNNCDGQVDEGALADWYLDGDGDGFGDPNAKVQGCVAPAGAVRSPNDCDDTNPTVYPGAVEACDGIDNDCDGAIELNADQVWFLDRDGDGYGDDATRLEQCDPPAGGVSVGGDCDDADPAQNPEAPEVCDAQDNDCDGLIDDEDDALDPSAGAVWYLDSDGDGWGDARFARRACEGEADEVLGFGDCDDAAEAVWPGAPELCNDRDDDCDGTIDENDAIDAILSYRDVDADTYGDAAAALLSCEVPPGYVERDGDCDDLRADVSPEGVEICNERDDDCNGATDELSRAINFASAPTDMRVNGSASFTSGLLQLTPAAGGTGTAFFLDPIPGDRFRASFRFSTGGGPGDGGDGMAFVFLDSTDPTLVGRGRSELGYGGLPGYGVEVDTYNNSGWDPTGNHVAVMNTGTLGKFEGNNTVPIFENTGWHTMVIEFTAPRTHVWVDGVEALDVDVYGYPTAELLLGFTAATGVGRNYHRVDDLVIDCP
jgi:hypothetical protein